MALGWVASRSALPIPADLLDREMLLGTATTLPDGSVVAVRPDGPQAHLATQGEGTAPLPPHFHGVDQFQYFTAGSGTVGGHRVARGIVHYSDRLTVYGPLKAGADGMSYLALRPAHDPGASFMPESRPVLAEQLERSCRRASDRRNLSVELRRTIVTQPGTWSDLVSQPDGLRVAVGVVDAGVEIDPTEASGAGAYVVVVDGAVEQWAGSVGAGALAWCHPGEQIAARAVVDHTRLALLQFPQSPTPSS
jgi:hypothetical protein